MDTVIGKKIKQPQGFYSFIPTPFPQKELLAIPADILFKTAIAERCIGKLDGITHVLPDIHFFLYMFTEKDAVASSQIEGTKATIIDALEKKANLSYRETDVDDIIYYIKALNYGLKRIKDFPISLRLIREIHKKLMAGARSTHFSDPGHFRKSQNYIGGNRPDNAIFVPPPVFEMNKALGDFEKFLHESNKRLPLIHIGIMHGQFETIHPFLDGNGRTGRMLITLLLSHKKLLEKPVLPLSSCFKKHQQVYYQKLNDYHNGKIVSWIDFFLDSVIETAEKSVSISKKIRNLRDTDMEKIQSLAKRESESSVKILFHLFKLPIVSTGIIMKWTNFTRAGAQKTINRFIDMDILKPLRRKNSYKKNYIYKKYVDIFQD